MKIKVRNKNSSKASGGMASSHSSSRFIYIVNGKKLGGGSIKVASSNGTLSSGSRYSFNINMMKR